MRGRERSDSGGDVVFSKREAKDFVLVAVGIEGFWGDEGGGNEDKGGGGAPGGGSGVTCGSQRQSDDTLENPNRL